MGWGSVQGTLTIPRLGASPDLTVPWGGESRGALTVAVVMGTEQEDLHGAPCPARSEPQGKHVSWSVLGD